MISKTDSPITNPLGYAGKIEDPVFGIIYVTFIPDEQYDFVLPNGTRLAPDAAKLAQVRELSQLLDPVRGTLSHDAIRSLRLLNYVIVKHQVVYALSKAGLRKRLDCVISWAEIA